MTLAEAMFTGVHVFGTPEQLEELSRAIDEANKMAPAEPLGDRLSAEIILRDYSRKIIVPIDREWFGLNWLEYDGKLKRRYR